jgi:hypothetical protein
MAFDARGSLDVSEWRAGRVTRIDGDRKRANFADGLSGPSGLAIGADSTTRGVVLGQPRLSLHERRARSIHVTGLATPAGLSFDRVGRLMIANRCTNQILAVTRDGHLEPIIDGLQTPVGAVQTPDGGYVVPTSAAESRSCVRIAAASRLAVLPRPDRVWR